MATCTATIKSGKRKGEFCGKKLRGREFCGYHDGHKLAAPKRRPRRRVPPPPEDAQCSICFEGMPEKYTKLECDHYYHTECIAGWFDSSDNRECCLCRKIDVATVIPKPPAPRYVPTSPSFRPVYPPPSGFVIIIPDDDDETFIDPEIPPTFVAPSFVFLLQLYQAGVSVEDLNMLIRGELENRYE